MPELPNKSRFNVQYAPSGAGQMYAIPAHERFRLARYIDAEIGEIVLLEGKRSVDDLLFDFGAPGRRPDTIRYYLWEEGDWVLDSEWEVNPSALYGWSSVDPFWQMAADPRDAILSFFRIRLAQMVRDGYIPISAKGTNHDTLFPVSRSYGFQPAELPAVSAQYTDGAGGAGDIGNTMQMHGLKITLEASAREPEEIDGIARALRGLQPELAAFLYHLDCHEVHFENFGEQLYGIGNSETVEPGLYGCNMTIALTQYTFSNIRDNTTWTLLPLPKATAYPNRLGNPVIVTAPDFEAIDLQRLERDAGINP